MKRSFAGLCSLLLVLVCTSASGQLIIIPDHPHPLPRPIPRPQPPVVSYKVKELSVEARLQDQAAQVQVSQTFVNTGSSQMEVQFVFPLPYDGAIDSLTLLVDGKEMPAKLLPKEEARRKYEEIVRRSKDPALLEWMGHGLFQTSVFPVPPGAERKVTLSYSQLLRKDRGVTDFLFPLSTAKYTSQPVEKVEFRVAIDSSVAIKNVYSPTHTVNVDRSDKKHVRVTYTGANEVPTSDFRLFFDVNPNKLGTSVLSYRPQEGEDGFFLLLTTPQIPEQSEQLPKTVVFVVDKSGSMSGEKIEQARAAIKFVLNNLREKDLFNIVAYDSSVQSFRPELENFTDKIRKEALGFVEGLYAGGGTNIHDALSTTLAQLQDSQRPSYVIFLTDGLPTVGQTNEAQIAAAAKQANDVRARLLSFGVGYDVNSRLLDRLARENFGASEYVRPDEDIEAHVSRVYSRIDAPVLTDVEATFEFDDRKSEEGEPINRVYPSGKFDLFGGEQLVLVGRYRKSGRAKIVIRGRVGEDMQSYDFPAELAEHSGNATYAFVEKLWATRRIGEIIDELDLNGKNDELVKELVLLSTKHGILTPYTSFLADETVRPTELATSREFLGNALRADRSLSRLEEAEGRDGVSQRSAKQLYKTAPNAAGASAPAGLSLGVGGYGGAVYRDIATDELAVTSNVRQVGEKTLYKRGKILLTPETAELDLEQDQDRIEIIERFTDQYFDLIADNTAAENQLLSNQQADEQLLVNLRGQAYLIK